MRNYIEIWTQAVFFTEDFTGQPIVCFAVGEDESDCEALALMMVSDTQAQLPGSTFSEIDSPGPEKKFFELKKHILARALFVTVGGVLAQPAIQSGAYLLVNFTPGARPEFDLDPLFFSQYLKDDSPRKVWSHGH